MRPHHPGPGALSGQQDCARVATEGRRVLAHPLQGQPDVERPPVGSGAFDAALARLAERFPA